MKGRIFGRVLAVGLVVVSLILATGAGSMIVDGDYGTAFATCILALVLFGMSFAIIAMEKHL